jgi:hypothetical protein
VKTKSPASFWRVAPEAMILLSAADKGPQLSRRRRAAVVK